jgi:hypothetical protein
MTNDPQPNSDTRNTHADPILSALPWTMPQWQHSLNNSASGNPGYPMHTSFEA